MEVLDLLSSPLMTSLKKLTLEGFRAKLLTNESQPGWSPFPIYEL
jgi:hypothetical protein